MPPQRAPKTTLRAVTASSTLASAQPGPSAPQEALAAAQLCARAR